MTVWPPRGLLNFAAMHAGAVHPQHSRLLFVLRLSLIVGAFYDLVFALLMVLAPRLPARLLDLPLPGAPFYLWVMAVLLLMLAAIYVLTAWDPICYRGAIVVAIVGRLLGGVTLAFGAVHLALPGLWVLALADLAFGLVHATCWWPIRPRHPS